MPNFPNRGSDHTYPTAEEWISLSQAAQQLGVHPTTLRRWADRGEIPVLLTPGGHRRFALSDLRRFSDARRQLRITSGFEQIWADQAITQTRQGIQSQAGERWLEAFDEKEREHKRELGRRLMGVMLQYVASNEGGEDLLQEAQRIGRTHADNTISLGLGLVEALQAMLFFRDTLVEAAIHMPEAARVRPEVNRHLLRRINTLLNSVQLAIASTYEQARR